MAEKPALFESGTFKINNRNHKHPHLIGKISVLNAAYHLTEKDVTGLKLQHQMTFSEEIMSDPIIGHKISENELITYATEAGSEAEEMFQIRMKTEPAEGCRETSGFESQTGWRALERGQKQQQDQI